MTGDYTRVPLRPAERWTGSRLQQGRVLVEHEWNLNLDATTRALADTARDVVGAAGVVAGSTAFKAAVVVTSGVKDVELSPGRIWVDGMAAFAPATFRFTQQDRAPVLPTTGRVLIYLEAFTEHIQPAEDWATLVDPALHPVDSGARTRVGWRVRAVSTTQPTGETAMAAAGLVSQSTGRLTIDRTAPPVATGACGPPGDPRGTVPHGLFRVEVLDTGNAQSARFVWSYENGAAAVPVQAIAGDTVTLAVSGGAKFAKDDLVEVSWLARRADRANHTALYSVLDVTPAAGGDVLKLSRPVGAPAGAAGLAVRRWDGQAVGASATVQALRGLQNLGVTFTAATGSYQAGDWWGAALRPEAEPGIERRLSAAPDGVPRSFVPLAIVNMDTNLVESDCRPAFKPLTAMRDRSTATVTVFPGEDLQAAVNSLPAAGGEVHLAAGEYVVHNTITIHRPRVTVTGVGPSTVIRAQGVPTALFFNACQDARLRDLTVMGGGGEQESQAGAVNMVGCTSVTVENTVLSCLDAATPTTSALSVYDSARVTVTGNQCAVGAWQTGILVAGAEFDALVNENVVRYVPAKQTGVDTAPRELFAGVLALTIRWLPTTLLQPSVLAFEQEYQRRATTLIGQYGTAKRAIKAFARYVTGPTRPSDIPESWWNGLRDALALYLVGGAGIKVGGVIPNSVRVVDNLVQGFAQGIHVGVSYSQGIGTQIRGNSVRVMLPHDHRRDRHAVAVSNMGSSWVTDTSADVALVGRRLTKVATTVDGVCLSGQLGPYALVRQNSFSGFTTGVRYAQNYTGGPAVSKRMWMAAENMTVGGTPLAFVLPVISANNFPLQ